MKLVHISIYEPDVSTIDFFQHRGFETWEIDLNDNELKKIIKGIDKVIGKVINK